MKKITLIQPRYPSSPFPGARLPVGLGYLAERLDSVNIPYDVVDMNLCDVNDLYRSLQSFWPDYVGITMMSLDVDNHYDLITNVKRRFPHAIIIAGGPHVSFMKEEVLMACSDIDLGVVNEGEEALVEIITDKDVDQIKGLIFRSGDKIIYNGDRHFNNKLDILAFPKYSKFDLLRYGEIIDIISSRGCPYGCIFCGAHFSMGKPWRGRSVASIIDEIEYWHERGYAQFNFVDSNFFYDKQRIITLCNTLKTKQLTVTISSDGIRGDDADLALLVNMKELGLKSVAIGVESANDNILKTIKKGETLYQIETAIVNCLSLGIKVNLFFIIGLPGETRQSIENSFQFALKYPVESAYFFNANPLPNTELYDWANANKFLLYSRAEMLKNIGGMGSEPLLATPELSYQDRKRLYAKGLNVTRKVQKRSKRKKILDKFSMMLTDLKHNLLIYFMKMRPEDRYANDIGTHLTTKEKLLLKHFAEKIPEGGVILEVGSYLGASAAFLASGCRKKFGTVYLVDTWDNDTMSEGSRDTFDDFQRNTEYWKNSLVPLRGESVAIANQFDKKIDLLFIDADHSYEGCSNDIKAWFPHLNNNARVVFHDYKWSEGVKAAVAECVKPHESVCGKAFENLYWTRISR